MKKQKEKDVEESIPVFVTYLGLQGKGNHCYWLNNCEKVISFKRKLQPHHIIGYTYPATTNGKGSYVTKRLENFVEPDFKVDKQELARYILRDKKVREDLKRLSEVNKLQKFAKEAIVKLIPVYQRASELEKRNIIKTIVKTLEK